DAPHLVLAPLSISDCVFTSAWAVNLAQRFQTAAIVLSDQFLGQSSAVVEPPSDVGPEDINTVEDADGTYLRYALTYSGLSPQAVPGDPGHRFTADGLEHNEKGTPSASADDHQAQLDKRARKLLEIDAGTDWGEVCGHGAIGLVCFGSASAAVHEAARVLDAAGIACRSIALRLLSPLPMAELAEAFDACESLIVVEQNHGAQLLHYLRGEMALAGAVHSVALPGPVPITAMRIVSAAKEVLDHE
ncbi:unnamed protein product, partial [Ectocarpus sp. 12 AP-2014]